MEIVQSFECYGNSWHKAINDKLDDVRLAFGYAHIVSVTATKTDYAGNATGNSVLVVIETERKA